MFRVVVVVGLILAVVVPLYLIGTFPPPSNSYPANFDRLWHAVNAAYPYFHMKGVDWQAVYDAYRPKVNAVKDDAAYAALVGEMLATLDDGHTGVVDPSPRAGRTYFGTGRALDDGIVIDQLGPTGRAAGLSPGDVLVSADGRPIEQALDAVPAALRSGSTPLRRRHLAAFSVLSTTGSELRVTVEKADGSQQSVTLVVPDTARQPASASPEAPGPPKPIITGERLASGIGLIRIPTLSHSTGQDLVAEFDAALDKLLDAPGLILDLRGNGGGDSRIGDAIAGRFLDRSFTYGVERFRLRLPQRGWAERFTYSVTPRGIPYKGPVVLLIDGGCFSSAEELIVALVDSGRATTVGRPTGAGSGNPVTFALPHGGLARFSTGAFTRNDGTPIEGVGIIPDVPVPYTIADYRAERDVDLVAAEAILGGKTGS